MSFWDCYEERQGQDLAFIVPNEKFDEGIGLSLNNSILPNKIPPFTSFKTRISNNKSNDYNDSITVTIRESRGFGVLDSIGGELWEAAYLLSIYILLNHKNYLDSRVLEVGSGCGLPSFLLIELMKKYNASHDKCKRRGVMFSDNDDEVLHNLCNLLNDNYITQDNERNNNNNDNDNDNDSDNNNDDDNGIDVEIGKLDWTSYNYDIDSNNNIILNNASDIYSNDKFDVIVGAACVYAPIHCSLADTIKYFLSGSCNEVIIIQIGSRPGMDTFISRLKLLDVKYTLEVLPLSLTSLLE